MARFIGIRHRTKVTAEDEARPTQVVIVDNGKEVGIYDLLDEQAELDFLLGTFPTAFRDVQGDENVSKIPDRHLRMKKIGSDKPPKNLIRTVDREKFVVQKVASAFTGIVKGDTVAMVLGGSGDYFAYALTRRGEEIGAKVVRVPSFVLKRERGAQPSGIEEEEKDNDATLLAKLAVRKPTLFYDVRARDKEIILLREAFRARIDAMKARIACEQRLRQHFVGNLFCRAEGYYPEGAVEKLYDEAKSSDAVYLALCKEETVRERELQRAVEASGVWQEVFSKVEGMGWAIASRIIAGVVDIRRFETEAKFKAFCGVHVLSDGRFPRRRIGQIANWHPDLRQAMYLFGDQMNRRPNSTWGKVQRGYKKKFRDKYPVPIKEKRIDKDGKERIVSRYSDGHIHKMATWRSLTKFAEWLYNEWQTFEHGSSVVVDLASRRARKVAA